MTGGLRYLAKPLAATDTSFRAEYQETGTLRMGADANNSVTNSDARLHAVANTYVAAQRYFRSWDHRTQC
jgi:choline dehydrogenase-like flavoprotein